MFKVFKNQEVNFSNVIPVITGKILCSRECRMYHEFLSESQYWDKDKITEFQNEQLGMLINHCYANVPYYHELFDLHGIKVSDIKDMGDLKKIPFIDKETAKKHIDKLVAVNFHKCKLRKAYTGGTASTPLHFFHSVVTQQREKAFLQRMWGWHGYNGQKCLILRGNVKFNGEIYSYNPLTNLITVNTKNLNEKMFTDTIKIIMKYSPQFMQAYPSIVWLFAKYINSNNLSGKVGIFKTIFCASEKLFDFQLREIEKAFGCNIVDFYGHNERLVLMQKCEYNNLYHIIPEYGITEILDENGNEVKGDNAVGEIIGTGFNNYAFPLIRYRTGDFATVADISCSCECRRQYSCVRKIDGRTGDFLITKSGKRHSPTILEFAIDYIDNFKDVQLVQSDLTNLQILIVPDKGFSMNDAVLFKNRLMRIIDDEINIQIKMVDCIERPVNQKKRFVVSNI